MKQDTTDEILAPSWQVLHVFAKALNNYKNKGQLLLQQGKLNVDPDSLPINSQFNYLHRGDDLPDLCWCVPAQKNSSKPRSYHLKKTNGTRVNVPLAKIGMIALEGPEKAYQLLANYDDGDSQNISRIIGRHICSNTNCVNPEHVIPDTHARNRDDETCSPVSFDLKIQAIQKMLHIWEKTPSLTSRDLAKRNSPAGNVINWLAEQSGRNYSQAKGILNKLRNVTCKTLLDNAEHCMHVNLEALHDQQWLQGNKTANNIEFTTSEAQDREEVLRKKPIINDLQNLHQAFYKKGNPWLTACNTNKHNRKTS